MCKYCENIFDEKKDIQALWFKRSEVFKDEKDAAINKNKKKIGAIMNLRRGPCLTIKGINEDDVYDWLDLRINFCPICGEKLRKSLLTEEQING